LAWSAIVSDDLLPVTDRLKEIGYDGIECFLGAGDKKAYRRLGEHVRALDMDITCVLGMRPDENPISPLTKVREKALDRLKWAIDRADDMNAKIICGPFHSAFATFENKAPDDQEYARSAEILNKAGEYAAQAGILLTPEAINRFECYLCNTMQQLVGLVKRADHPNIKAHYDTHHANIEEKNFKESIQTVAPVLGHVHISENDRGTPGDGHIDWDEIFVTLSEIQYKGWLTIEAFTRNDPDFANSINVWREYSRPWDMAEKGFDFLNRMCKKYDL